MFRGVEMSPQLQTGVKLSDVFEKFDAALNISHTFEKPAFNLL